MTDLSVDAFKRHLRANLEAAKRSGISQLDVRAGDLHREVGVYPAPGHAMPSCCAAMRQTMGPRDHVLSEPPKGRGASLTIRYHLAG